MPALKDVLSKGLPEGYVPVENAPPATSPVDDAQFSSSMVRCPLPPTNADADSLRTFQKGSSTPQFRVMPLPPQTGGTSVVTTGGASGGASSGGSSSGGVSAIARTATVSVNIPANSAVLTRVAASRSFQLFSVGSTAPADVRLYGSQATQSSDSSRKIDAPVPAELTQGLLLDVVFDTVPYFWNTQNITGVNADSPQTTNLYVSVFNPNPTPLSNVSIYVTYFPLES